MRVASRQPEENAPDLFLRPLGGMSILGTPLRPVES